MKKKTKNHIKKILLIGLSLIISAFVYNLFLLPLKIVPGGTSGIATITYYLYDMNPAIMIYSLSIACFIIGWMYLGVHKIKGILVISILYPILIELTSYITCKIHMDNTDILLMVLFASVLSGIANGLLYRSGFNRGGFYLISQIIQDKFKISISKTQLLINIIIATLGALLFGTNNLLYAILYLYINRLVKDRVLLGISTNKAFYIVTNKEKEVKDYVIEKLKHNVTTFSVKGGFKENNRKAILTVVPSRDYFHLTEGIKLIDKEAFFVAMDAYEVEGAK